MTVLLHMRCILLFFLLLQSVSLYKIYAYDNDHPSLSSSSFNDELTPSIINPNIGYEDAPRDDLTSWKLETKRSLSSKPQRRNNRPHWNPLVAAYKRCSELISQLEREACFKEAVQMLFVYKLKK